jgi:hypothetical protein
MTKLGLTLNEGKTSLKDAHGRAFRRRSSRSSP